MAANLAGGGWVFNLQFCARAAEEDWNPASLGRDEIVQEKYRTFLAGDLAPH
jgi:hypothetical protein